MRALVVGLAFVFGLACVPAAFAWSWPVDGPVLRPFVFGGDPYLAGQHRGIDIGAAGGTAVGAPAGGVVSFVGTVPGGGAAVTIRTGDGYSATLVHLGSTAVMRGAVVEEGAGVGTVGPSGDAEWPEPYVHLGVRVTAPAGGLRRSARASSAAVYTPSGAGRRGRADRGAGGRFGGRRGRRAHRSGDGRHERGGRSRRGPRGRRGRWRCRRSGR